MLFFSSIFRCGSQAAITTEFLFPLAMLRKTLITLVNLAPLLVCPNPQAQMPSNSIVQLFNHLKSFFCTSQWPFPDFLLAHEQQYTWKQACQVI